MLEPSREEVLLLVETLADSDRVRGTPVTHDEALVAQVVAQVSVQRRIVLASVDAVDLVVGAHERADVGLEGSFERRVVHLEVGTLVDLFVHEPALRLLTVVSVVLNVGHDSRVLDALDNGTSELAAQNWILAT